MPRGQYPTPLASGHHHRLSLPAAHAMQLYLFVQGLVS